MVLPANPEKGSHHQTVESNSDALDPLDGLRGPQAIDSWWHQVGAAMTEMIRLSNAQLALGMNAIEPLTIRYFFQE
jgi:hypothetical protein